MRTRKNRLREVVLTCTHNVCFEQTCKKKSFFFNEMAVLTSTHNLCFEQNRYTPSSPDLLMGYKGVYITQTCFLDVAPCKEGSLRSMCRVYVPYSFATFTAARVGGGGSL